jgi:hypothetical protein
VWVFANLLPTSSWRRLCCELCPKASWFYSQKFSVHSHPVSSFISKKSCKTSFIVKYIHDFLDIKTTLKVQIAGVVAHTCNPSCSGGGGRKIVVQSQPR